MSLFVHGLYLRGWDHIELYFYIYIFFPGRQVAALFANKAEGWEDRNLVYSVEITTAPSPTWSEYLIGVIIKVGTTERR